MLQSERTQRVTSWKSPGWKDASGGRRNQAGGNKGRTFLHQSISAREAVEKRSSLNMLQARDISNCPRDSCHNSRPWRLDWCNRRAFQRTFFRQRLWLTLPNQSSKGPTHLVHELLILPT